MLLRAGTLEPPTPRLKPRMFRSEVTGVKVKFPAGEWDRGSTQGWASLPRPRAAAFCSASILKAALAAGFLTRCLNIDEACACAGLEQGAVPPRGGCSGVLRGSGLVALCSATFWGAALKTRGAPSSSCCEFCPSPAPLVIRTNSERTRGDAPGGEPGLPSCDGSTGRALGL